ncbi:MAG: fumarate reductase subunit FrdD [Candidatus Dechloromonas phosphoritropha]|jgi:fumarate reductase subunit D|nr:fumarate reductase subunit FrdD [Candidatus Dechloromonas phosphoritropha]MBP8788810.1 fumarate reductase subunit FrdD [Azonexus sp.]
MKRSNEPILWSLFGAGGMLAALIGPALVIITGIAVPFGLLFGPDTMSYGHMLAFAQNWVGKIVLFAVVSLFLWHAMHRIAILLHDFGVHAVSVVKFFSYGFALLGTVCAGYALLTI